MVMCASPLGNIAGESLHVPEEGQGRSAQELMLELGLEGRVCGL